MSISETEYQQILQQKDAGQLEIYIDKASFRQLFMSESAHELGDAIGESLALQKAVISVLFYSDPAGALATCAAIVGASGWWSLVFVPVHIAFWFLIGARASIGPARVGLPAAFLLIGATLAASIPQLPWSVRVVLLLLPISWAAKPVMYYVATKFAFDLIHRNYQFFRLFYYRPGQLGFPFIWTDPDDQRFAPAVDARIVREMEAMTSESR